MPMRRRLGIARRREGRSLTHKLSNRLLPGKERRRARPLVGIDLTAKLAVLTVLHLYKSCTTAASERCGERESRRVLAAAWLAPSDDAGRVPSSEREGKRL